jgi:hypothetical protein
MSSWLKKITDVAKAPASAWRTPTAAAPTPVEVMPSPLAAAPTPVKVPWWNWLIKVGQPDPYDQLRKVPLIKVGEELDATTKRRGALYCKGVLARARARKASCAEAVNGARIAQALGARTTAVALAKYAKACR